MVAINKWRRLEDARAQAGLIGPNAILQLLPLIERVGGRERVAKMMAEAGMFEIPDGEAMVPERDVARLHGLLRQEEPILAPRLAGEAGQRTAEYILAHRIPKPVQVLLRMLPARLAAPLLARAIAQHAWTFAGSGTFTARDAWTFEIADNPVIAGEVSDVPICHWHAAVFGQLYRALVHPRAWCEETVCGAQPGRDTCRFEIRIRRP